MIEPEPISIETALYYSDAAAPHNGQRRVDRCHLRANSYPSRIRECNQSLFAIASDFTSTW